MLDVDQCSGEVLWRTCQEARPISDKKRSKPGKILCSFIFLLFIFDAQIKLTILNLPVLVVINRHCYKYEFPKCCCAEIIEKG